MGRMVKPGADPKAIKQRTRAAQKARTIAETAPDPTDPYEMPPNVRPRIGRTAAELRKVSDGVITSPLDPTLLHAIQWALGKAVMGFTYRQISQMSLDEIGYPMTEGKARRLVTREMERKKDPLVREIRRMEDHRLDFLLTKLEDKVNDGDVQAIHEARLISESRRKMFGADMPANIRVTGEVEHKLDPAVTKMIEESKERIRQQQHSAKAELEDPEIVDAEVVEEPDYREAPYEEHESGSDDFETEIEDL